MHNILDKEDVASPERMHLCLDYRCAAIPCDKKNFSSEHEYGFLFIDITPSLYAMLRSPNDWKINHWILADMANFIVRKYMPAYKGLLRAGLPPELMQHIFYAM
jgi:hypothetical protein